MGIDGELLFQIPLA